MFGPTRNYLLVQCVVVSNKAWSIPEGYVCVCSWDYPDNQYLDNVYVSIADIVNLDGTTYLGTIVRRAFWGIPSEPEVLVHYHSKIFEGTNKVWYNATSALELPVSLIGEHCVWTDNVRV